MSDNDCQHQHKPSATTIEYNNEWANTSQLTNDDTTPALPHGNKYDKCTDTTTPTTTEYNNKQTNMPVKRRVTMTTNASINPALPPLNTTNGLTPANWWMMMQHQHYHNDNEYDKCTDTAKYNNKWTNTPVKRWATMTTNTSVNPVPPLPNTTMNGLMPAS